MKKDIIQLKAELLCLGAKVEREAAERLAAEYPRFFDKGYVHAVNFRLRDANINVSVSEAFAAGSPYQIVKREGTYRLVGGGWDEPIRFYPNLPRTGTVLDDLAQLHSPTCINIWPSTTCCYDTPELKCRFCSLQPEAEKPVNTGELSRALELLLAQVPKDYALNFSGGTYGDPDRMVRYWIDLARKIRVFSDVSITVEFAPPSDLRLLGEMKAAGVNVAIMNLEVADPELRKEICPGKSGISYAHYHAAFREAVRVFGWGMVSSVLIGGIQPKEDIMRECGLIASEGVFPTVMPFRPMDDCVYHGLERCRPEDLLEMGEHLGGLLMEYGLDFRKQPGCTECGGCSLENDCRRRRERLAAAK